MSQSLIKKTPKKIPIPQIPIPPQGNVNPDQEDVNEVPEDTNTPDNEDTTETPEDKPTTNPYDTSKPKNPSTYPYPSKPSKPKPTSFPTKKSKDDVSVEDSRLNQALKDAWQRRHTTSEKVNLKNKTDRTYRYKRK